MKNKILVFAMILFTFNLSAQQSTKEKELINKTIDQLNLSLKSANTMITAGAIITGAGIAATLIGVDKYSKESKQIKTVDYGQLPGIMDNQVQMNKTIPAAMIGVGGIILTGAGLNILAKGILKSNDIKVELVKYSNSLGVGLTLKF